MSDVFPPDLIVPKKGASCPVQCLPNLNGYLSRLRVAQKARKPTTAYNAPIIRSLAQELSRSSTQYSPHALRSLPTCAVFHMF